jgi:hypothetical protein
MANITIDGTLKGDPNIKPRPTPDKPWRVTFGKDADGNITVEQGPPIGGSTSDPPWNDPKASADGKTVTARGDRTPAGQSYPLLMDKLEIKVECPEPGTPNVKITVTHWKLEKWLADWQEMPPPDVKVIEIAVAVQTNIIAWIQGERFPQLAAAASVRSGFGDGSAVAAATVNRFALAIVDIAESIKSGSDHWFEVGPTMFHSGFDPGVQTKLNRARSNGREVLELSVRLDDGVFLPFDRAGNE